MNTLWPAELTERLRVLWSAPEKLSAADIASILTKEFDRPITRNATLGRVHRIGLERRDRVEVHQNNGRPRTRIRKPSVAAIRADLFEIELAAVEPRHIDMLELKADECRYPYGDGPFTFCGCETAPLKPYCSAHAELCATNIVRQHAPQKVALKNNARMFA